MSVGKINDYFSRLQTLLVSLILNGTAKAKLAMLEFLYCGDIMTIFSHPFPPDLFTSSIPKIVLFSDQGWHHRTHWTMFINGDVYRRWAFFHFLKNNFGRTSVLFLGPLIAPFWISGDICPGFQSQGGSLTCVLPCLHAMDYSYSPLVQHLLTFGQHFRQNFLIHVIVHFCTSIAGTQTRDRCAAQCAWITLNITGMWGSADVKNTF